MGDPHPWKIGHKACILIIISAYSICFIGTISFNLQSSLLIQIFPILQMKKLRLRKLKKLL